MSEKIARQIAGLLEKAEKTNYEGERDLFLAKAQELQVKYVIEDSQIKRKTKEEIISQRFLDEEKHSSFVKAKRELIISLGVMNRCQSILGPRRAYLDVMGYESDVRFVSIMYTSLLLQMETTMSRDEVFRMPGESVKSWRTSYAHAWVRRVVARLREALKASQVNAEASTPGAAMVLRDRSEDVVQELSARYGKLRTSRQKTSVTSFTGYNSGDAAGYRANLNNRGSVENTPSRRLTM